MSLVNVGRSLTLSILLLSLYSCGKSEQPPAPPAAKAGSPSAGASAEPRAAAPATRIEAVEDSYHGVTVTDPYRWLEASDSAEVQKWSEAQNAYARGVLAALPERPAVHARITEILKSDHSVTYTSLRMAGDGGLLAMKHDPDRQQAYLVFLLRDGDPGRERVILDPNELDPAGHTSIDWFRPSHGGSMVAVSLSRGGSESGDVHVYRIDTTEPTDVVIPRVNYGTGGGDLAWLPDDSGFYYTRYPRPGERAEEDLSFYMQVWLHMLGSPAADDAYVIGKDFPRIVEIRLISDQHTGRLLVWLQEGDSNRFALHLRQPDGRWSPVSDFADGPIQAAFGPDGSLFVISRENAPRGKILKLDASNPDPAQAVEVVPQGDGTISHNFYPGQPPTLTVAGDRLYTVYQVGGPNELRVFSLDGKPLPAPPQIPVSTVAEVEPAGDSDVYYNAGSFVTSAQWFMYHAADATSTTLGISSTSTVDYSDVEVAREFATSKDGTRVPVNILRPKGAPRDGTRAVLLSGYGGYGVSLTPAISMSRHILFEHGMLYAQANLRGGGEYGEEWHTQGNLTNKQNVFDDFAAVARFLVEAGYAAADKVAIVGGSNGGLLMGAAAVQRPDLYSAVVSHVGIYDMLRVELDPNGAFNIPEFGTVQDPEEFRALRAYSPYHNVRDGVKYPPILLTTGANDPRVNPYQSRKFAARLQAAQDGHGTVLLRTSGDTGHGGGTPLDETIELLTDQYAFIFHQLGIDAR